MADNFPYRHDVRFIYGIQTRCALVSFRGRVEYIGPFFDRESAVEAAKVWFRARGWTGKNFDGEFLRHQDRIMQSFGCRDPDIT